MTSDDVSGADAVEQLRESGALEELMPGIDAGDIQLTGEGGFPQEMVKAVPERGLQS